MTYVLLSLCSMTYCYAFDNCWLPAGCLTHCQEISTVHVCCTVSPSGLCCNDMTTCKRSVCLGADLWKRLSIFIQPLLHQHFARRHQPVGDWGQHWRTSRWHLAHRNLHQSPGPQHPAGEPLLLGKHTASILCVAAKCQSHEHCTCLHRYICIALLHVLSLPETVSEAADRLMKTLQPCTCQNQVWQALLDCMQKCEQDTAQ